jgi:hypothetical protein
MPHQQHLQFRLHARQGSRADDDAGDPKYFCRMLNKMRTDGIRVLFALSKLETTKFWRNEASDKV